jgi:hypothetical protein
MTAAASAVAFSPGTDAATVAASEPHAATAAAMKAMADSATTWARELIDGTRHPCDPDSFTFPTLERPPLAPFDVNTLPSLSDFRFSDNEDDTELHSSPDDD